MIYPYRQQLIIGVCTSLMILSTASIILRFLSRRIAVGGNASTKLWWDDWFALLGLVRIQLKNITHKNLH